MWEEQYGRLQPNAISNPHVIDQEIKHEKQRIQSDNNLKIILQAQQLNMRTLSPREDTGTMESKGNNSFYHQLKPQYNNKQI